MPPAIRKCTAPPRIPTLRTLHTHNPTRPAYTCSVPHAHHKCLVPNAFTHSLRSLAHLNRGQCQTLRTCPGLRI
jgi:hypothetical protein